MSTCGASSTVRTRCCRRPPRTSSGSSAATPGPEFDALTCAGLIGALDPPLPLLDTLASAHLVHQHTPGRYTLHDLLRLYAAELLDDGPPQERVDGTERLLRHFLDTARLADHHLEPWRPTPGDPPEPTAVQPPIGDNATAADWFETELPSLQAAIARAADTPGLGGYAWRLADACAVHLRRSGRRAQRAALHALARDAAARSGDRVTRARPRRLADALSRLNRTEEALGLLYEALRACRALGEVEGVREVRLSLVRAYDSGGAPAERCRTPGSPSPWRSAPEIRRRWPTDSPPWPSSGSGWESTPAPWTTRAGPSSSTRRSVTSTARRAS